MIMFQVSVHDPKKIARILARCAVRALYEELALYPKPGLVSLIDAGAHEDMNAAHFIKSIFALRHYFYQVALDAAEGVIFPELVLHGLHAEQRMLAATGGINTHRGAIFALGIVCASLAQLWRYRETFSLVDLEEAIIKDWADYLYHGHCNDHTHGAWVRDTYNVSDAKHLAIIGYAPIWRIFVDIHSYLKRDKQFFGLLAYKELLLLLDDINILYRCGQEGLLFARTQMQGINRQHRQSSLLHAHNTHKIFSQKKISPGGVADMLALIFFVHFSSEPLHCDRIPKC